MKMHKTSLQDTRLNQNPKHKVKEALNLTVIGIEVIQHLNSHCETLCVH